jgi:DNA repair protein RadC
MSRPPLRDVRERPRERLRRVGPRNLSREELLTLVVGSGNGCESAGGVARAITRGFPSLCHLAAADVASLERVPGVGRATASRLVAAFELGRRAGAESEPSDAPIRGPADVFRRVGPRLRDAGQEEFREVLVTRGILDAALIHPREVFRVAVGEGAAGVILVHNHPSGDPTPSEEDRAVTRQLSRAGRALGIPVLDHVVVGRGRYVSLAAELEL